MSDLSDITPDPIISEDVDAEEFELFAASEPETVEVYKDYTAAAKGACAWANRGMTRLIIRSLSCTKVRVYSNTLMRSLI